MADEHIARSETLWDTITIGPHKIETWQEHESSYRVEIHRLQGRSWRMLRGPYRYRDLDQALTFALDTATQLRDRPI